MTNSSSIISGTVLDPDGQPVPDARVYFIEGPVPLPDVALLTDQSGEFTLSVPVSGTYKIGCSANEFESTTVTVNTTTDQNLQIEILLTR